MLLYIVYLNNGHDSGKKIRFPNAFTSSNKSKSSNYRKFEPMAKVIYIPLHT